MLQKTIKRLIDFTASLLGLLVLSPFLLFLAVLIAFKLGRPVLFTQMRPGLHCKPFRMIKFRTMTNARDAQGKLLPNEQRQSRFGNILRSASLDELPELINVLKGEMSLVGPRPLEMRYLPYYSETQNKRHLVRPGITGWAQVNGRNTISWEEKFNLDVWYVENQSLWLDIRILFKTVLKVFKREGINSDGFQTVIPFDSYIKRKQNN